jgi:hypothetical protein
LKRGCLRGFHKGILLGIQMGSPRLERPREHVFRRVVQLLRVCCQHVLLPIAAVACGTASHRSTRVSTWGLGIHPLGISAGPLESNRDFDRKREVNAPAPSAIVAMAPLCSSACTCALAASSPPCSNSKATWSGIVIKTSQQTFNLTSRVQPTGRVQAAASRCCLKWLFRRCCMACGE